MKDTILAACNEISSHPIFSRRITSGSVEFAELGNIGDPEGAKPKIYCFQNCKAKSRRTNKYLHPNTRCTPSLQLVLMSEETHACSPSTVIECPWRRKDETSQFLSTYSTYRASGLPKLSISHCQRSQQPHIEPQELRIHLEEVI